MTYVESSREAIQKLLAEISEKPVAVARKGNFMAFLTMPLAHGELVAEGDAVDAALDEWKLTR